MKRIKIVQFGNAFLRQKTANLSQKEILAKSTQELIASMKSVLTTKKLGVGLAAPQLGENKAVAVVNIQKTPLRQEIEEFSLTIINPKITKATGRKSQMWEGCLSSGEGKAGLFAKVPRYKKLELEFYDEKAVKHIKVFDGLKAHIIQHEVDHLNGVLFVDKVKDTNSYMTYTEYKKMKQKELRAK